jgi:hypothetical protein
MNFFNAVRSHVGNFDKRSLAPAKKMVISVGTLVLVDGCREALVECEGSKLDTWDIYFVSTQILFMHLVVRYIFAAHSYSHKTLLTAGRRQFGSSECGLGTLKAY